MNKKILIIVSLAVVIAVSGGVIAFVATHNSKEADTEIIAPTAAVPASAVLVTEEVTAAATEPSAVPVVTEQIVTEVADNDPYGYTDLLCAAGTYRVKRVYDHAQDCEVTAREVFGKLYSYCSLRFYPGGSFELCVNPTSGEIRRGSYAVYGNVISANYDSGSGTEFTIASENPGQIDYIIVNYGDYDVYFGLI